MCVSVSVHTVHIGRERREELERYKEEEGVRIVVYIWGECVLLSLSSLTHP
jgi:hypothetical protein